MRGLTKLLRRKRPTSAGGVAVGVVGAGVGGLRRSLKQLVRPRRRRASEASVVLNEAPDCDDAVDADADPRPRRLRPRAVSGVRFFVAESSDAASSVCQCCPHSDAVTVAETVDAASLVADSCSFLADGSVACGRVSELRRPRRRRAAKTSAASGANCRRSQPLSDAASFVYDRRRLRPLRSAPTALADLPGGLGVARQQAAVCSRLSRLAVNRPLVASPPATTAAPLIVDSDASAPRDSDSGCVLRLVMTDSSDSGGGGGGGGHCRWRGDGLR